MLQLNIGYNIYNENTSNDEMSVIEKDTNNNKDYSSKNNINNIIKNNIESEDNFDIEKYYNESINF